MASDTGNTRIVIDKNSAAIRHLCGADEPLRRLIHCIGDIAYALDEDSFAFMIDTIIGQMLSNKVADVMSKRLLDICGGSISPSNLEKLSEGDLRGIGLSFKKAEYMLGLARHIRDCPDFFADLSQKSDEDVLNELTKLRGVGSWSAKMYLIFVLGRPDVLPHEDGAFQQAFAWLYPAAELSKKGIIEQCARWRPYSSIASRYLYMALDSGLTKRKTD